MSSIDYPTPNASAHSLGDDALLIPDGSPSCIAAVHASMLGADSSGSNVTLSGFEGPEKLLEIWFKQPHTHAHSAAIVPDYNDGIHGQILHPNNSSEDGDSSEGSISDCENPHRHYLFNAKENDHDQFSRSGLRVVRRDIWEDMLNIVQCKVLSVIKNKYADAYLLSESSMFVYKNRIVLKTCGTTTLLNAVTRILAIAKDICGFGEIQAVFYSRKAFLFPERQAWPHGRWGEEVAYLDTIFPDDQYDTSGYVVGKINGDHWCLYVCTPSGMDMDGIPVSSLSDKPLSSDGEMVSEQGDEEAEEEENAEDDVTLEILMTHLDPEAMKMFWRNEEEINAGNSPDNKHAAKHRFKGAEDRVFTSTGISDLYPGSMVDDYVFDPCGYSLNGLLGPYYYTIHVTPEDICSYASFETTIPARECIPKHARKGSGLEYDTFNDVVQKVVDRFKPGKFSTTLFVRHSPASKRAIGCVDLLNGAVQGFRRRDRIMHSLGQWDLVFCHFEKPALGAIGIKPRDSSTAVNANGVSDEYVSKECHTAATCVSPHIA
ncbi:hypothetical protein BASA50_004173 [Batrachochytrium salamandrivorans]|uniref:Adenosylmethionine decarboxylase n=1 Tax=Batrachochytrium salamandrivorans TaxID=1357716 RepID=A0ABQ8FGR3_9FUNG|nr:hypothetical protein BASA62_009427 [Batrachochytrium salamandrivorans]KAH6568366.1 hypothetical protein BASA60_008669 [Batrachochytrium salamandrivorans]KAH6597111.1 hypothetical protein BASA61_003246 [Batrachochytrium salamandrivorans]KAH6597828.1 hypothetical protein BASA50_004173 [Batrachochytrium salamandrivorans]KAH9269346.1 S-adenosylmethionine decarboxylase proenzyme [Batrachochytrium salamandrivorans]